MKEKNQIPPYTHNLLLLIEKIPLKNELDENEFRLLEILNSYYIESRYTEELKKLSVSINKNGAASLLTETKALAEKIKLLLNGYSKKGNRK